MARASARVRVLSAPLDAAYATDEPRPSSPPIDDTSTTLPWPLACSAGRSARTMRQAPTVFTS